MKNLECGLQDQDQSNFARQRDPSGPKPYNPKLASWPIQNMTFRPKLHKEED